MVTKSRDGIGVEWRGGAVFTRKHKEKREQKAVADSAGGEDF